MAVGLVSTSPETGLRTDRGPSGGRMNRPGCLWMTGEATGQPGPAPEHIIQTRR
jgi:hypothetical protein